MISRPNQASLRNADRLKWRKLVLNLELLLVRDANPDIGAFEVVRSQVFRGSLIGDALEDVLKVF